MCGRKRSTRKVIPIPSKTKKEEKDNYSAGYCRRVGFKDKESVVCGSAASGSAGQATSGRAAPTPEGARAAGRNTRARCGSAALVCREEPRNLRAVWLVARSVEERHMVHRGWASTHGISVRVHTHIPDALSSQRAIVTLETDKSNARARSVQNPEFFFVCTRWKEARTD